LKEGFVRLFYLLFFYFLIKEVPVIMRERTAGESSITPIRAVYYMVKVMLVILARFTR